MEPGSSISCLDIALKMTRGTSNPLVASVCADGRHPSEKASSLADHRRKSENMAEKLRRCSRRLHALCLSGCRERSAPRLQMHALLWVSRRLASQFHWSRGNCRILQCVSIEFKWFYSLTIFDIFWRKTNHILAIYIEICSLTLSSIIPLVNCTRHSFHSTVNVTDP